jgi:hypothetical protein
VKNKRARLYVLTVTCMLPVVLLMMGCGADMTVEKVQATISSGETRSAAILSGSDYAAGGAYKVDQSIGSPLSKPSQQSADGRYKVR